MVIAEMMQTANVHLAAVRERNRPTVFRCSRRRILNAELANKFRHEKRQFQPSRSPYDSEPMSSKPERSQATHLGLSILRVLDTIWRMWDLGSKHSFRGSRDESSQHLRSRFGEVFDRDDALSLCDLGQCHEQNRKHRMGNVGRVELLFSDPSDLFV